MIMIRVQIIVNKITNAGKSMSPTLNPDTHSQNDIILVDTLTPLLISYGMAPNYSDKVVLLRHPCQDRMLVKRVEKQIEGKGVYVRGDEGFRSEDSRVFGTVPLALVRGVGLCIVYPLSRFGMTMERRSKFKSMK